MTDAKPLLGFIGIGLMGTPMTLRLLAAGYKVSVWNRTAEKLAPVVEHGATPRTSAADVARNADIVFQCLTDADAVETVVFGDDGIAQGGAAGKILVDLTSAHPDKTRELAKRLEESNGMYWIDAPVSGGVTGAEAGTLAIFAGGEPADVSRVEPVMMAMCKRVTYFGPTGAGQVAKLCNQVIVGGTMALIAEAVSLAEQSGIDASALPDALEGGFADSIPLQIFGPRFAARKTEPLLGHVYTMLKDIEAAREIGERAGAPMPMSAMTAELLGVATERGHGEHDIGAIMELFEPAR